MERKERGRRKGIEDVYIPFFSRSTFGCTGPGHLMTPPSIHSRNDALFPARPANVNPRYGCFLFYTRQGNRRSQSFLFRVVLIARFTLPGGFTGFCPMQVVPWMDSFVERVCYHATPFSYSFYYRYYCTCTECWAWE